MTQWNSLKFIEIYWNHKSQSFIRSKGSPWTFPLPIEVADAWLWTRILHAECLVIHKPGMASRVCAASLNDVCTLFIVSSATLLLDFFCLKGLQNVKSANLVPWMSIYINLRTLSLWLPLIAFVTFCDCVACNVACNVHDAHDAMHTLSLQEFQGSKSGLPPPRRSREQLALNPQRSRGLYDEKDATCQTQWRVE